MKKQAKKLIFKAVAAFIFCIVASPSAQALNVQLFRPGTGALKGYHLFTSETLKQKQFAIGMSVNWAHHLFELRFPNRTPSDQPVVDDFLTVDFLAEIGIFDWWTARLGVPMNAFHNIGDDPFLVPVRRRGGPDMGDIQLTMIFKIFDAEKTSSGLGLAFVPQVTFPTGDADDFFGDANFTGGATLVGDAQWKANRFYANIGFRAREHEQLADLFVNEEITYGLGWQRPIRKKWRLDMILEAFGAHVTDDQGDELSIPIEILAAARKRFLKDDSLILNFGAGFGVTEGYGTPSIRSILGLTYAPPVAEQRAPVREKIEITEKIHFEFDKAVIRKRSYPVLDQVVRVIKGDNGIRLVHVEGHTDSIGSDPYNLRLSERRSRSVVNYLVAHGVERDRLKPIGFGETRPIATNATRQGRAMNRRTEFIITERR